MYEPHTAREDTIVFPAFKKAVGPKGYDELGDRSEDIERKEFGGGAFDMAVAKVGDLERRLGTADLAAFYCTFVWLISAPGSKADIAREIRSVRPN